jgi:endonuclease/exonuclease/phosphatase family metal-dependent hydrolase
MRSLFRNIAKMASAVLILFTALAYLCPWVNPKTFHWLAFVGTAFPWLLLAHAGMILLWTWRLSRFALYHIAILLFGWTYITGFLGFDFGKDAVPETAIHVGTHNLGGLFRGKKITEESREQVASRYARFLQENGSPDVLCTQETGGKFYRLLAEKMNYPHTFNLKKGTVILSRFPIEAGGDVPFGKTANSTLWADIRLPNGKLVRFYNVHLQSNKVTGDAEKVIGKGDLNDEETWQEIGSVLERVGSATGVRAEQAERLREHILGCKIPVVLCGDFNDTPNSYVYALLSNGLNDTFRQKALGLGTTFGGVLPLLRIDYVLTEKSIQTYACRTVRSSFSDHYPVFVSVGYP